MNEIALPGEQTMSSREIAELTGKRHDLVMRDIRNVLVGLDLVPRSFEGYYTASNGKANPLFNLPKRETLILVSGYNVLMRAKIIRQWREMKRDRAAPSQAVALTREQHLANAVLLVVVEKVCGSARHYAAHVVSRIEFTLESGHNLDTVQTDKPRKIVTV